MKKFTLKENKKTFIFAIALFLFLLVTYAIFSNKINSIDQNVHAYILGIRSDNLTKALILITNISGAYSLIVITILLFVFVKNKKIPLYIMINLICSFLISYIVKFILQRPRPTGINLIDESGYSYPSAHAMVSMAFFGFIAYLIYKKINNKLCKIIFIILILIMIGMIGFSRIYLGVHYLSDVVGGFLLSISYLMMFIKFIKLEPNKEK